MDNMSQSTPAHQLVTKETAPLINKPRRGGILLGLALFRSCFGFFPSFSDDVMTKFLLFQLLAAMVRAEGAEGQDSLHRRPLSDVREAEEPGQK